jgi:hypothetical protein
VSKREQVGGVGTTSARREAPIRQVSENSFTKRKRHAANPRRHHTPSSSVAVDSRIAVRGGFLYVAQRSSAAVMQVSLLVTEDVTRDSIAYGSNRPRHLDALRPYAEAS